MVVELLDEEAIFKVAVEIPAEDARSTYLQQVCGNDRALLDRVLALLRVSSESKDFLESPPGGFAATAPMTAAFTATPGTQFGPYKILEQIGEGGMGIVYVAEQTAPVRRKVALKIIKPGMNSRDVVARFEAERQALAMMDHPNIAKVHDAGATENGQPYFVMELVQGVPITEYCDQCNLTTCERLEQFVTVCQAVQHAHQKGVIHRDIKPTNVLVAIQDGQPAPKIIDFGVAKAVGQRLTEHTLTTAFAQMVGSPLYMSPEQAELSPLGVDTRSDIYSLGVMLYELLTGATPFDRDRLHEASYDELRRIIREEEPPRPSARISTLAADLASTVADHRRTDARRLSQTVRGELDWIVMKCLEKDRNRRYETPNSLARDIERYLADEPVQACPPSAAYRLKKFVRRNKVAAAFVALLVIAVVGLGISNIATKRERNAKTTALARAQAISDLLQEMLASSNPEQVKGVGYTVRELLDDFSAGLGDKLAGQPEAEADVHGTIGRAYHSLGVYDRAELHTKKALDLRRELFGAADERVADDLIDHAWSLDGLRRHEEAERFAREALSIYQKRNADPRKSIVALGFLQNFLNRQSRFTEAEEVANEALALARDVKDPHFLVPGGVLNAFAETKSRLGKHKEAEVLAREAVEIRRRQDGDHHPNTAWALWTLADALRGQQKYVEAETALRETLAILRACYTSEHDSIKNVSQQLKLVLEAKGDRAGVEALIGPNDADEAVENKSRTSDEPEQ